MKALLQFAHLIDRLNHAIGRAVGWLILAAVLISAFNALVRKLLGFEFVQDYKPLKALYQFFVDHSNSFLEIQWNLFAAVFLLAAAYTLLKNEHVRIDLLFNRCSPRTQAWIDLLGALLFLLPLCGLTLYHAWPFFLDSYEAQDWSNSPGGLILWPAKFLIPAGFTLLALQALSEILKRIAVITGHAATTPEHPA